MSEHDEQHMMGRLMAAIFVAVSLFGFLSGLPGVNDAPRSLGVLHAASALALGLGFCCLLIPWTIVPRRTFELVLTAVSVDIGVLTYAEGSSHGDLSLLFTFVVVFAAYFFSWRAVLVQLGVIAALLGLRLVAFGTAALPAAELVRLAMLVPALTMIAWLVSFLRKSVSERDERLERVGTLIAELPLEGDEVGSGAHEGEPAGAAGGALAVPIEAAPSRRVA